MAFHQMKHLSAHRNLEEGRRGTETGDEGDNDDDRDSVQKQQQQQQQQRQRRRQLNLNFKLRPDCVSACRFQEILGHLRLHWRCGSPLSTDGTFRAHDAPRPTATYFLAADHQLDPSWFWPGALEYPRGAGFPRSSSPFVSAAGTAAGVGAVDVFSTPGTPVHTGRAVTRAVTSKARSSTSSHFPTTTTTTTATAVRNTTAFAHFAYRKTALDFFLLTEADIFASNCNYQQCYSPQYRKKHHGRICENTFAYHAELHRAATVLPARKNGNKGERKTTQETREQRGAV